MSSSSISRAQRAAPLRLEALEDRTTPTFLARPAPGIININGVNQPAGGLSLAIGNVIPDAFNAAVNEYVTGTGPGVESLVRIFDLFGNQVGSFVPFPGFRGGINVAVGDVVGSGTPEIVVGIAQNGPPHVKVFTPAGQLVASFYAFDPAFMGGVNIATGNVLGGIGSGGFGGGNSQFKQEIIIGAAAGNSPHVVVTDPSGTYLRSFFAFDAAYLGGVTVAASSIDTARTPGSGGFPGGGPRPPDTNSFAEIIIGAATAVPHVKIFSVWQGGQTELQSYYAFDPALGQGLTVAAGSTDGNRGAEIYAGLVGSSRIRAFSGATQLLLTDFTAFPQGYSRVVNMAIGNVGVFDPRDDDDGGFGGGFGNPFFNTQDLSVVAGDAAFQQVPRYFRGLLNSAAGRNGP
ncbi:MAG: hypothetical protein L0241_01380 [Planctomycetia bacterium]|nr:hypothetical protein [Planctomycetia bacterium]